MKEYQDTMFRGINTHGHTQPTAQKTHIVFSSTKFPAKAHGKAIRGCSFMNLNL